MGKGSGRRPTNETAFAANFDKIFGKSADKKEKPKESEKKKVTPK
jgi:uncharacterized protein with von Willebrand factor type A (vWA) domain